MTSTPPPSLPPGGPFPGGPPPDGPFPGGPPPDGWTAPPQPPGSEPGPPARGDVLPVHQPFPPPPPPPMAVGGFSAPLVQIGDIGVTVDTIVTPNGEAPLAGSTWVVTDQSRLEERMPAWAIVLAVVFFLACLLGLLFLLVKERKMVGYIEVRVQSGDLMHMTQIPARDPRHIDRVRAEVGQIQARARRVGA